VTTAARPAAIASSAAKLKFSNTDGCAKTRLDAYSPPSWVRATWPRKLHPSNLRDAVHGIRGELAVVASYSPAKRAAALGISLRRIAIESISISGALRASSRPTNCTIGAVSDALGA